MINLRDEPIVANKLVSVISAFGGSARAFFDCSIAVDRFADRIACAARWGFRGMGNLPRWTRGENAER
jgi:hypothetical protein